jgi:hypothetical protein
MEERQKRVMGALKIVAKVLQIVAIVVALVISIYTHLNSANKEEVKNESNTTRAAVSGLYTHVSSQGDSIGQVQDAVREQHQIVEAMAEAIPDTSARLVPIRTTPTDIGCFTIYGGMVRCNNLDKVPPSASVRMKVPIEPDFKRLPQPLAPF